MVSISQPTAGPKRIQSLQNAMAVIEAIANSEDGMRLLDLAQQVGLSSGAVHHIVDTLVEDNWLVRTTHPLRYRLGPVLINMSGRQQRKHLNTVVDQEMISLLQRSGGDSVSFCEAAGNEILLTRAVQATRPDVVTPVANTVLPPYTSAASIVHLAFWAAERSQAYRELRPFEVHAGGMWGALDQFNATIRTTQAEGFVALPLSDPHSLRIGVPVLAVGGALVASLTVTASQVGDPAAARNRIIVESLRTTDLIRSRMEGTNHD